MSGYLSATANIAEILTAVIAVWFWIRTVYKAKKEQQELCKYLAAEYPKKRNKDDGGDRSLLHLVAALKMTEDEIIQAAFHSNDIEIRLTHSAETGRADIITFSLRRDY
ncbi:hypothetical protein [Acetobacter oeni]|uniref:hypothetical protein n=1 Tax=Acetobacter oeni TaxID=304077 RepID=UPI0011BD9913|nr:hypothetical protein [Acetobacter oeni]MBB3885005.1 hypothetical protein [Acetobacter oeni]NHO20872.1 hypothetical protein [Acetobacter oeni]